MQARNARSSKRGHVAIFILTISALSVMKYINDPYTNFDILTIGDHVSGRPDLPLPPSQVERQLRIAKICQNISSSPIVRTSLNILVENTKKLAYCSVPKSGSTNWNRVLVLIGGKITSDELTRFLNSIPFRTRREPSNLIHLSILLRKFNLYFLRHYYQKERDAIIEHYYKFMFVRSPYHRLLSAYRDKFEQYDYENYLQFHLIYGRQIIKLFRKNASWQSLLHGSGVTFEEFLRYILYLEDNGLTHDIHWRPYHALCDPCHVKYDYIGKLETIREDAEYVLNRVGASDFINHFPSAKHGPSSQRSGANTTTAFQNYYSQIPEDVLSNISRLYRTDFDLFDYDRDISVYR